MNKSEKRRLKFSLIPPGFLLLIMWAIKAVEYAFNLNWYSYGIFPKTLSGLKGILFSPFLHGDFDHLISNSIPFLLLGTALFYFYRNISYKVFGLIYLLSGFWVWLAARDAYHIGASGMIYGLASFLFFSGLIHRNRNLASISLIIVFIYGSMIWGIFPLFEGMSWESHLFGGITGLILSFAFARTKIPEMKEETDEDHVQEFSDPDITDDDFDEVFWFIKDDEDE